MRDKLLELKRQSVAMLDEREAAVKKRDPSISTVFYMNAVLSWYFYRMNDIYEKEPSEWLYASKTHVCLSVQICECSLYN